MFLSSITGNWPKGFQAKHLEIGQWLDFLGFLHGFHAVISWWAASIYPLRSRKAFGIGILLRILNITLQKSAPLRTRAKYHWSVGLLRYLLLCRLRWCATLVNKPWTAPQTSQNSVPAMLHYQLFLFESETLPLYPNFLGWRMPKTFCVPSKCSHLFIS